MIIINKCVILILLILLINADCESCQFYGTYDGDGGDSDYYNWWSCIILIIIEYTLVNPVTENPDRNMKNEKCCSQLSTHFKGHMACRKAEESLVCSDKT
jgi:hypothetical protein